MTEPSHDSLSFRVLLLEDDDFDLLSFRRMLSRTKASIELEHHSSLHDAQYSLTADTADVIIADMNLLDSRGLATFIGCKERWPDKPILVLSGIGSEQVARECVRMGAQDYLVKGDIDAKSLMRAIRYAIERQRANQDRESLLSLLEESRKFEAMGQLAGGVAHEISAPARATTANCTFAKAAFTQILEALLQVRRLASPESTPVEKEIGRLLAELDLDTLQNELSFSLDDSLGNLEGIHSIVGAMEDFSTREREQAVATDLNRAIEMAVVIASGEWKSVARLEKDLDEDLPWVKGTPGSLNQAILNLLVHASHSVAEAAEALDGELGKIRVQTRQIDGSWVEVQIQHTGAGSLDDEPSAAGDSGAAGSQASLSGLELAENLISEVNEGSLRIEERDGESTVVIRLLAESQHRLSPV